MQRAVGLTSLHAVPNQSMRTAPVQVPHELLRKQGINTAGTAAIVHETAKQVTLRRLRRLLLHALSASPLFAARTELPRVAL